MLVIAQNCIVLNMNRLSSLTPFLNSHGLMALYIKRPRLEEERIGRGMPSGFVYLECRAAMRDWFNLRCVIILHFNLKLLMIETI